MRTLLIAGSLTLLCQNLPAQDAFFYKLADSALTLIHHQVSYNPAYVVIPYPNGDVPQHTGVCTDVIIRAYRLVGIDLQKEVHVDMSLNFEAYPKTWGLKNPTSISITAGFLT